MLVASVLMVALDNLDTLLTAIVFVHSVRLKLFAITSNDNV